MVESFGQRRAFDEFEDERDDVFAFFERVDGGDVRMIQGCEDLRLALEASNPGRIVSQRRRKHLDGDVSAQLDVARAVHVAHAAGADARGDFVFAETSSYERGVAG